MPETKEICLLCAIPTESWNYKMDLYLFITEGECYPQLMFGPMKVPGIRYKYKKPALCTLFLLLI